MYHVSAPNGLFIDTPSLESASQFAAQYGGSVTENLESAPPAQVRGYGLHPNDYSGHVPDLDQYGRPVDRRIDTTKPVDYPYPPVPAQRAKAEKPVKQARDRAQYVRQQKGHSWLLHWIVLGVFTMWIVPIYYSFSPNHYWHI